MRWPRKLKLRNCGLRKPNLQLQALKYCVKLYVNTGV